MRSRLFRWAAAATLMAVLAVVGSLFMRSHVENAARPWIISTGALVPARFTAIVPGCRVNGDDPSRCLEERLSTALELYNSGLVNRLLLSGDHGTPGYDEVNAMRSWLIARGVQREHIFLDHAGFDTWDTMVRARQVFQVEGALVVTQGFHLPRAIYLARAAGLDAIGVPADPTGGSACMGSAIREPFACAKAVMNVILDASPTFLGPTIPISGSPQASLDQP